ncbi:hypothetical protein HGRIS_003173 [Hohenbuehelia grisea]|uniref:HIT-type domain-containing protein n=1 Tax=Hohenbuehelia grisea TaxID=104357 RepID=A0ABR3JMX4_9AGAR
MPRARAKCQICNETDSKYTCSTCFIVYCSVPCYRNHKETTCAPASSAGTSQSTSASAIEPPDKGPGKLENDLDAMTVDDPAPLRPLTSLKWPYVPEESAYPDPLKRDDPKPLQLPQYEAIATSQRIRTVLEEHPNLPALLKTLDQQRGPDQRAPPSEDVLSLRALAEAVEAAVREGKEDVLGLNWGE